MRNKKYFIPALYLIATIIIASSCLYILYYKEHKHANYKQTYATILSSKFRKFRDDTGDVSYVRVKVLIDFEYNDHLVQK